MADWDPKANGIFLEAAEIDEVDARRAFLDRACGSDAALRRRVEALLKSHDDAGSFLETPAIQPRPTEQITPDRNPAFSKSRVSDEAKASERGFERGTIGRTVIEPPTDVGTLTGGELASDEISLDFLEPSDRPGVLGKLGSYEITETIGRGGMGVVLKGQDTKLNRVVAIKVLAPELASNPTARKRFLREAQAAAAVSHDHVVTIHAIDEVRRSHGSVALLAEREGNAFDIGERSTAFGKQWHTVPGLPYIVMEYVAGWSLQERIDQKGPLEVKEILRIARQTALGLAAAHEQGLIHRDIKPANILLENGIERVKLTDFGLARAVDDVGTTGTGVVAGTPQYMSPEQAQGEHVDHRSDLFSLGCVMYAMCTGRSPFRGESTVAVIRRVCDDVPRPISQVNSDIPDWLVAIIDRLLEKRPEERFQSAREVAELLGKYLAHLQHPSQVPLPEVDMASRKRELPGANPQAHACGSPDSADGTVEDARAMWRDTPCREFGDSANRATISGLTSVLERLSHRGRRLIAAAVTAALLLVALGMTEATGVTHVSEFVGTVLRIVTPHGTLVVQVDDPNVGVMIGGEDVVITGAGPQEVRLKPGSYRVTATKDGRPIERQLVTITRGGKQVVRISLDGKSLSPAADPSAFDRGADYPKLAPFDAVRWDDTTPTVRVNGTWYELVEIDGVPVERIVAFCKQIDGRWWQKRFEEDLVQVMSLLGHRPGETVDLTVKESGRGEAIVLRNVPMTHENRRALWKSRADRDGASANVDDDENSITEVRRFEGHTRIVSSVAVSPDGRRLVAGTLNGEVLVWNLKTGDIEQSFKGHKKGATEVAFGPDGSIFSCSRDGTARRWDADTGKEIQRYESAGGQFRAFAISPGGKQLLTASWPGQDTDGSDESSLKLWNVETGKEIRGLESAASGRSGRLIADVAFSPDGKSILAGGSSSLLALWDVDTGKVLRIVNSPSRQGPKISAVAFSPDGRHIARAYDALNDVRNGRPITRRPAIVAGRAQDESGNEVRWFRGHSSPINAIAFSPDGRFLASASGGLIRELTGRFSKPSDNTLRIWDVETGEELVRADLEGWVQTVAFTPDGRYLVTGSGRFGVSGNLRLWRLPQSVWPKDETNENKITEVRRFGGLHTRPLADVAYLPSEGGSLVATASYDGTMRIWDVATGREAGPFLDIGDANAKSMSASPDGKTIAVGDHAGSVYLWDTEKGELRRKLAVGKGHVSELAFSPDGSRLHVGMAYFEKDSGAVVMYDAASGERLGEFEGAKGYCLTIEPLDDGVRVLAGGEFRHGGVWDSRTGRLLTPFRDLPQTPYALAASPDGRLTAIGFRVSKRRDNRWDDPEAPGIWLYDVETGRVVRNLPGHTGMVNDVLFSADGRFLVSGSGGRHTGQGFVPAWDNTLRVWDAETGAEIARAEIETEWGVSSLALMPDGRHVVTASGDNGQPDLRLWRLPESVWPKEAAEEPIAEITLVREFPRRNSVVHDVAITPDGRHALSGGWNDFVAVWDVAAGSFLHAIETDKSILNVAIVPDGHRAVANGTYDKVYFLDLRERRIVREVEAHDGMIRGLSMSPDGKRVVTGGHDKTAAVWDTETGKELKRLKLSFQCYVAAFVPDGRHIILGGSQGYCQLWDLESGRRVRDFHGHVGNVFSAVVSADGRRLLTGCEVFDPNVRLWDLQTGQNVRSFRGHEGNVWTVDFLPDGKHIISGCDDGTMRVWALATGREVARATWPNAALNQLAVNPDGRQVVSAGGLHKEHNEQSGQSTGDYSLRLWQLPQSVWPAKRPENCRRWETNHLEPLTSVAVSSDGRYVLSCGYDKTVRLSDIATGKEVRGFLGHTKSTAAVAFSPDGEQAVSGGSDGTLRLWNVETGDLIQELRGHTGWVRTVAFSPDGKFILSGSADYRQEEDQRDRSLRLWDAETGEEIRRFDEIDNAVNAAAFTPDSRFVVAAGEWKMVGLWEVETGQRIRRFATPDTHAVSLAISPDGTTAATGHVAKPPAEGRYFDPDNSVVCLWDIETGRLIRKLRGHTASVNAVAFSPDGRFVLSGSGGHHYADTYAAAKDNSLRLWDVKTGEEVWKIEIGTCINSVALTPDGRHVVSGGGELALGGGDDQPDLRLWRLPQSVWADAGRIADPSRTEESADTSPSRKQEAIGNPSYGEEAEPVESESHVLEIRILADEQHHAKLIQRAKETFPESLREDGRVKARWIPVSQKMAEAMQTSELATMAGDDRLHVLVVHSQSDVTGKDVTESRVVKSDGIPSVRIELTEEGADRMKKLTGDHKPAPDGTSFRLAIVVNGELCSAPLIRDQVGGTAVLTGLTNKQAAELAVAWKRHRPAKHFNRPVTTPVEAPLPE